MVMEDGQNQSTFLAQVATKKGFKVLEKLLSIVVSLGVNTLTLFAFSSENLNRSSEEVGLLFKLFLTVLKNETTKLNDNNIKLKIIGDLSVFTPEIQRLAIDAEKQLKNNNGLNLVIAANYGGQWDIAESAKKIAIKSVNGEIDPEKIDASAFPRAFFSCRFP